MSINYTEHLQENSERLICSREEQIEVYHDSLNVFDSFFSENIQPLLTPLLFFLTSFLNGLFILK